VGDDVQGVRAKIPVQENAVKEAEWLGATDPTPMLEFLRDKGNDRKFRLFDLASGLLSFGNQYHWHPQVLGTESQHDGSWLWVVDLLSGRL